jgi:hypothetical protein
MWSKLWAETPKRRDHMRNVYGKDNIKMDLTKHGLRGRIHSIGSG